MAPAPLWTDIIMAIAAGLTAALTLVLALMAIAAWRTARKTLEATEEAALQTRATVEQMREDSAAQREDSARRSRPYLFAQIVPSLGGLGVWDLLIENKGRSGAFHMRMVIEPAEEADDQVTQALQRLAKSSLSLPPGGRVRSYWFFEADKKSTPPHSQGYPAASVTLHYQDSAGQRFTDPTVYLAAEGLGLTPAPTRGSEATQGKEKHERNQVNALRAIAHHLGEIHR